MHRLIRTEPVTLPCPRPHALQVATRCQVLRAAVLERDIADLPTFRRTPMLGAETLRCLCDLAVTVGERVAELGRHARDLEVLAVPTGALLNRIPLPRQLLRERGAV